jgi:hypothetical protein
MPYDKLLRLVVKALNGTRAAILGAVQMLVLDNRPCDCDVTH